MLTLISVLMYVLLSLGGQTGEPLRDPGARFGGGDVGPAGVIHPDSGDKFGGGDVGPNA